MAPHRISTVLALEIKAPRTAARPGGAAAADQGQALANWTLRAQPGPSTPARRPLSITGLARILFVEIRATPFLMSKISNC
jgi:hypothetical protein